MNATDHKSAQDVRLMSARTLEDDLPIITQYAAKYHELDTITRIAVSVYVNGKSVDYYYGAYTAMFQAYILTCDVDKDINNAFKYIMFAISDQILRALKSSNSSV